MELTPPPTMTLWGFKGIDAPAGLLLDVEDLFG
jgi:hypothetical protein